MFISRWFGQCVVAVATIIFLSSCIDSQNQSQHSVVVVDLQQVAQETGHAEQIAAALKKSEQRLVQQLADIEARFQKLLDDQSSRFGEKPTEEQQKTLAHMRTNALQKLQLAKSEAVQQQQQAEEKVRQLFHTKVRPVVKRISDLKGAVVVLTPGDNIFQVASAVDITQDVIDAMKVEDAN